MTAAATSTQNLSTWTIDASHSHVEFAVRHMMVSTVKGHFEQVTGTVEWDGTNLDSAVINVEIPVGSISTKNEQRDDAPQVARLLRRRDAPRDALQEHEDHRRQRQRVHHRRRPDDPRHHPPDHAQGAESNGQLRDPWGMDRAGFHASGKLDRLAYGLNWNAALETGGFVVSSDVKISLDIEITKPGE